MTQKGVGKGRRAHWERVHRESDPTEVSWYQPHLARSLELIRRTGVATTGALLDVGGGTSTLVDDLVDAGYTNVTVLDLSAAAIQGARQRLGQRAGQVTWIEGDVTTADLPRARFDVWHDRAVFHFLVEEADRRAYVRQLRHALKPGGTLVIATFGPEGPLRCSGLPAARYRSSELRAELGAEFELLHTSLEDHVTPGGRPQQFLYCLFRRVV